MGVHRAVRHRTPLVGRARSARRRGAVAALLATVLGLLCAGPAAAATGTYVRLAELSESMPGTELTVASIADPQRSVTIPGIGYGGLSEYRRIEPGDYVVGVRAAGSDSPPAISTTLNAQAGSAYTLADIGGQMLRVLTDDLTPPPAGQGAMRVIAAAPDVPLIDVRGPGGAPLALGLPFGGAGGYMTVPAGPLVVSAGAPGGPVTEVTVPVGANQVISVLLVSGPGGITGRASVDADGPVAMPPGPVNAGFGGARPGGPLGAVVFGLLAVVATGLSAHLVRRSGGSRPESC